MDDMDQIMDDIKKQLGRGRLENVQETLQRLSHEQQETIRIRARTTEMRKQINAQTDPARKAEMEAAPLSAETAAQQLELRQGLQRVQKLLNEAEVKMTELRADLASLQNKAGANGSSSSGPMPTVEAVERTILRMTAMIQQKSGDIDLLESRIKHLPNGTASLHLADDYEDDLAARFGGSRFVTDSPSRRTPQKYPRMAANGDALGMSGMFGFASSSRYRTPPSASASMRASVVLRGSMSGSAMRHSTGSWNGGGSARKKMADVTDEEVEIFRARTRRRKDVLGALQRRVEEGGPRIVKVD
jgi:nucleoporin NUP159